MLRAWQDVIVKWQLLPDDLPADEPADPMGSHRGRSALLAGKLDTASAEFETAVAADEHPLDRVGLGDVHLARGRWELAARNYSAALAAGGLAALLAKVGLAQVQIGQERAAAAIADLEHLVADRPADPVLRYYLASAWYSVAEQCRARTDDDVLVITSYQQLQICEDAARRILDLKTGDDELTRGAEQLLAEVTAGRRWIWAPEGIAVSLAVLTVALGLITVVAGGLMGNVLLVILGVVVGAGLLFAIVYRFRRQTWRRRADQLAQQIVKPGV
jgi:tetratricopeptide (TPR) repeat protein